MKLIKILLLLFAVSFGFSQQRINYKAKIKDASGNILENVPLDVRFSIKYFISGGTPFIETHHAITDANGMVILRISEGITNSGSFSSINWNSRTELKVEINLLDGNGWIDLGTSELNHVPYAIHAENVGLKHVTENGNTGYRLAFESDNRYANIGDNSIDLSMNPVDNNEFGASGFYSFAVGREAKASGEFSTALGWSSQATGIHSVSIGNSIASGDGAIAIRGTSSGHNTLSLGEFSVASGANATAIGFASEASAEYTFAAGKDTNAIGIKSTALGFLTTASNNSATSMGNSTLASGQMSTAMGYKTKAEAKYSTAIGSFNIGGGNPSAQSSMNKIFEIGNGSAENSRSNAFTVYGGSDASVTDNSGFVMIGNDSGANIVFDTNEIMARNNGNSSTLYLQNDGGAVRVGGVIVHASDRRLKKNIENLNYGLKEVLNIEPKQYNWKNREQKLKSFGVIAQDIEKIIPNIVHYDKNEHKTLGVSYTELIPVLIKAIQEQQQLIDNLDKKITSLTTELNKFKQLEDRLRILESTLNK
jgi:hypothetical protein